MYSSSMADDSEPDGSTTPQTPKINGLSLTEYTANPSPLSEKAELKSSTQVPEAFLLPDGYPDVHIM